MKKVKIIILLGIILVLSGCSIEYSAIVSKDSVKEVIVTTGMDYDTIPVPAYKNEQGASEENIEINGVEYYDKYKNEMTSRFEYTFPIQDYSESRAVNSCLESFKLSNTSNKGEYIINTSSYFSCMDLYPLIDDIKIKLTFNEDEFEVIKSNANNFNNSSYEWLITRDNYTNSSIQVVFKTKETKKEENESTFPNEENNNLTPKQNHLIILGSILAFVVLVFVIIMLKLKRL